MQAIEKLIHIADYYPIEKTACECIPKNDTLLTEYGKKPEGQFTPLNETKPHKFECEVRMREM